MSSKADLKKFSDAVATIKSITRVYEQAAARRMRMVKVEIEKISDYVSAASESYSDVKYSLVENFDENIKKVILNSSFRKPTRSTVLVLISSQTQYFGQLIPRLSRLFISEYKKTRADCIILGKVGRELMEKEEVYPESLTVFDFDDMNPDWTVVHKVSESIANYAKIVVFYGEYKSVFTQEVKSSQLSEMVVIKNVPEAKKFRFRPSASQSLGFLENQMIASGFMQKLYESQIAKYAARIKILEIGQVAEKISSAFDDLSRGKRRYRKLNYNKKQQQLYVGAGLWQEYS